MNRYTKKSVYIIIFLMCMIFNQIYACDEFPIADIDLDPEIEADTLYRYIYDTTSIEFDGSNSHDPDNGTDPGAGIVSYWWRYWDYQELEEVIIAEGSTYTTITLDPDSFASYYGLGPGKYAIDFYVWDDDGAFSYWPDYWDTRDFFLIDAVFTSEHEYIPYGTGNTFSYYLLPGAGWQPNYFWFYVKDEAGNYAYKHCYFPPISMGTEGDPIEIIWDGTGNSGSYSGSPLPAGNYTATLDVRKSGTIMKKNINITVFNVNVDYVVSDKDIVEINENVLFTVVTDPPGYSYLASWSGDGIPTSGSGETFTSYWESASSHEVKATIGSSNKSKTIDVVGVDWLYFYNEILIYWGDHADETPTLLLSAFGHPSGGKYSWECSKTLGHIGEIQKVSQSTSDGIGYITVKGKHESDLITGDAKITVTYTVNGKSATKTGFITVRRPASTTSNPGDFDWSARTHRNYFHRVIDQFGLPINVTGIPCEEIVVVNYGQRSSTSPGSTGTYSPELHPTFQYGTWTGGIAVKDILGGNTTRTYNSRYTQELIIGGYLTTPCYIIYIQPLEDSPWPCIWKE
jgi:hypothetical protein